ncbi:MAG: hypothetical protein R2711_17735 [Acidimicrobiales bacterium]
MARTDGVIAGTAGAQEAFRQIDDAVTCTWAVADGDRVVAGQELGTVSGSLASVLTAERTALNLLGHLSGIATRTRLRRRRRACCGCGTPARPPRPPRPGEGGGPRRRRSQPPGEPQRLGDVQGQPPHGARHRRSGPRCPRPRGRAGPCTSSAIASTRCARRSTPAPTPCCSTTCRPTRCAAVEVAEEHAAATGTRRALLEVSGGITLETVRAYATTGADVVSSGSLTNSAPVLDIGLDIDARPS